MRFYRVHLYKTSDGSCGYEFFTARAAAERCAKDWLEDTTDSDICTAEIENIDIAPTKSGILQALKNLASHAENG